MKTSFLAILLLLSADLAFAENAIDYEESIAYAYERTASKVPKEKAIVCLGPSKVDEFYIKDGKEEKRVALYARVNTVDENDLRVPATSRRVSATSRLGHVASQVWLEKGVIFEICVFRKTCGKIVRVVGMVRSLRKSQFSLKGGDLIIIRRAKTQD